MEKFNKGDIVTVKKREGEVWPGYGFKFKGYETVDDNEIGWVELEYGSWQGVSVSNLTEF